MELNPNCSTIIWRLSGYHRKGRNEFDTDTSEYPNGALGQMIELLEEAKNSEKNIKGINIEYIDNEGGGGDWDYVEDVFGLAKQAVEGKISEKAAKEKDEKRWMK